MPVLAFSFIPTTLAHNMALRLLVNTGLLAIPIGGAVGTLMGLDAHRSATGQPPLFTPDGHSGSGGSSGGSGDSTGGGQGHTGTTDNGVTNTQYCELSYGVQPPTQGEAFTCMGCRTIPRLYQDNG